ncbi:MAG: hypothetical protein WBF43_13490, partial [Methylocella sp.]
MDSVFQVLPVVLDQKNIVAAAFDDVRRDRCLPEDRGAGGDLAFPVKPLQEFQRVAFQRVRNFEAVGAREAGCPRIAGTPARNAASTRPALPSPALLARIVLRFILSSPEDDGDMMRFLMRFSVIRETAGAEDIGLRADGDAAQGFGQRRTRDPRSRLPAPGQTASAKKRCLPAAPSAQRRTGDQAQDRPSRSSCRCLPRRPGNGRKIVFTGIAKA